MKKGYFVSIEDDYGIGVVAESSKEAKKIGYNYSQGEGWDWEYIDVRVNWKKDAIVKDLPIGAIEEAIEGLKRNIYGYVDEEQCPICGNDNYLTKEGDVVGCSDCIDKLEEVRNMKDRSKK